MATLNIDQIFIDFGCAKEDEIYRATMRLIAGKYVAEHVEEFDKESADKSGAAQRGNVTAQLGTGQIEWMPCVFCQTLDRAVCPKCKLWVCVSASTDRRFVCRPSCGFKCRLVTGASKSLFSFTGSSSAPALPSPESRPLLGNGIAGFLPGRRR